MTRSHLSGDREFERVPFAGFYEGITIGAPRKIVKSLGILATKSVQVTSRPAPATNGRDPQSGLIKERLDSSR